MREAATSVRSQLAVNAGAVSRACVWNTGSRCARSSFCHDAVEARAWATVIIVNRVCCYYGLIERYKSHAVYHQSLCLC